MTVSAQGSELSIAGLGRSYSTRTCWESLPGVSVVGHSSSARSWNTRCSSSAGDPRRTTITTTLSASSNDQLQFTEVGLYEFDINGEHCRAEARRTRSFSLVEREGESRAAPAPLPPEPPEAPLAPTPEPAPKTCAAPGVPARLEVRPNRKLLRAGESFQFRARLLDAEGCLTLATARFSLATSTTRLEVTVDGKATAAADAPRGMARIEASFEKQSVSVQLEVVSKDEYDALLKGGAFDASGATGAAVATLASAELGAGSATLENKARSKRLWLLGSLGALAGLLGAMALWLMRRRPDTYEPGDELGSEESSPEYAPTATPVPAPATTSSCPTCHTEHEPGQRFCLTDGNRLVPSLPPEPAPGGVCPICRKGYDPGTSRCPVDGEALVPAALLASASEPLRRICPVCGTIYEGTVRFCGLDGATLAPLN